MTDRRLSGPEASDALAADQHRIRHNRATTARALTRRRWRRRVLPPLAVTSAVMLGTGTAGAWVHAALAPKSSPVAAPRDDTQLTVLDQLRQQLASDQQTLATLISATSASASAGSTAVAALSSAPAPGQPTVTALGAGPVATGPTVSRNSTTGKPLPAAAKPAAGAKPPAAGAPAAGQPAAPVAAPTAAPAPAPTTAPSTKPTTAPAPAPTTKPPAPPPTVQATTGASGAKP